MVDFDTQISKDFDLSQLTKRRESMHDRSTSLPVSLI